jgi:hypothetical protein
MVVKEEVRRDAEEPRPHRGLLWVVASAGAEGNSEGLAGEVIRVGGTDASREIAVDTDDVSLEHHRESRRDRNRGQDVFSVVTIRGYPIGVHHLLLSRGAPDSSRSVDCRCASRARALRDSEHHDEGSGQYERPEAICSDRARWPEIIRGRS